jgi:ABC-2 type transport system ATP-binding protein
MLTFTNVSKSYGARLILSIPDGGLAPGIYWLQGPNGSGKTTLLRMMAGLIPFKGDMLVNGHSLKHAPIQYKRTVSWADAEPRYPGFLTGEELIAFYNALRKPHPQQSDQLLSALGMQSYIGTRIGAWSDGMTKKLSLVLAFIGRPALVILDEFLVTLDKASVSILYQLIRDRHNDGCSFLFTSHQDIDLPELPPTKQLLIRDQKLIA